MAEMRHMKKPEPGRPGKPAREKRAPERSGAPRPPKVPMGRDRAFREALAREYGVTEVPRSLQLRTRKTLEELPEALPKPWRPVVRAFKSMAAAAAVLAICFAALLGLNSTHPQVTEALPGLGTVFATMNGRQTPSPSPAPAPTPTPKPEFLPVTALSKGDFSGTLVVNDAWTDGNVLTLEMYISTDEKFGSQFGAQGIDSYDYITLAPRVRTDDDSEFSTGVLTVSTDNDYRDFTCGGLVFTRDDPGKFTARWQIDLGGLEAQDSIKLDLEMPDMAALYSIGSSDGAYFSYAGFSASFALDVDRSYDRLLSAQSGDGPVTLRSVDYSPGRVEMDVSLPYLGMIGDLYEDSGQAFQYPLGSFASLTFMDGQYEYELDSIDPAPEEYEGVSPDGSTTLDMHYVFRAPDSDGTLWPRDPKGLLTLTLYEFPQYDGPMGRVTAEFTIDLSTGRAYPSSSYEKYGFEKDNLFLTTQQRFENAMTNGLLLPPTDSLSAMTGIGYGPFSQFTLFSDMSYGGRELAVFCYMGDTLEHTFTFVIGAYDYGDSDGSYSNNVYTLPSSGQEYLSTTVLINLPDRFVYGEDDYTPFTQLELIDPFSGEVLIPDLAEACRISTQELLGGGPGQDMETAENDGVNSVG